MRKGTVRVGVLIATIVAAFAGRCDCAIVNPSFETGTLEGWDQDTRPDHMRIASGTASQGDYYLTADIQWTYIDAGYPGGPSGWYWQAGCWQHTTVPSDPDRLMVDIRTVGTDPGRCGVVLSAGASQSGFAFSMTEKEAVETSAAPNGFTRYIFDITGASGLDWMSISIIAAGGSEILPDPTQPIEFSVDNFQFVPEPSVFLLLLAGIGFLQRRRRAA